MSNFDEMSRRIQWSEIEFSHSLSPEPTTDAASGLRLSGLVCHDLNRLRLSFLRLGDSERAFRNTATEGTTQ